MMGRRFRVLKVAVLLLLVMGIAVWGFYLVKKDPKIDYALASQGHSASTVSRNLGAPFFEKSATAFFNGDPTQPILPGHAEPPLRPFRTLRAYKGMMAVIFVYFDERDEVKYVFVSWP